MIILEMIKRYFSKKILILSESKKENKVLFKKFDIFLLIIETSQILDFNINII